MPRRDFCLLFFQLVKKLSDLTGCTQVVDVGSGQVSQTLNIVYLSCENRPLGKAD